MSHGRPHLDRLPEAFHERLQALRIKRGPRLMNGCFCLHDPLGNPVRLVCKSCGEAIMAWVPIGDPVQRRVEGNVIIQETRVAFFRVAGHAQVVFEMEDVPERRDAAGNVLEPARLSKHVSAFCLDCARHLTDDDLEAAYLADLESSAHVDHQNGVKLDAVKHVYEFMAKRRPLRILGLEQEIGG